MASIRLLLLYIKDLLSSLPRLFHRSLRRLFQLCALINLSSQRRATYRRVTSARKRPQDTTTVCPSQVPIQLSPIVPSTVVSPVSPQSLDESGPINQHGYLANHLSNNIPPSSAPAVSSNLGDSNLSSHIEPLTSPFRPTSLQSPYTIIADPSSINVTATAPTQGIPRIQPMTSIQRYDGNPTIPSDKNAPIIPALTTSFDYDNLPKDWTPHMHPEGALYWVHQSSPIYTDAHLCDQNQLNEVDHFLQAINRHINHFHLQLPPDWELVLELYTDVQTHARLWRYYFVYHASQTLFWIHDFRMENLVDGVTSDAHIRHEIESYYWTHFEMYPNQRQISSDVFRKLEGIIIHGGVDSLTSPTSTTCYSEVDLSKLLKYVQSLKLIDDRDGYPACVAGRLMSFFAHARFLNFHGQECARLSSDQTIYDQKFKPRSLLFIFTSACLFFAPTVYIKSMEDLYTDWVIYQHKWVIVNGKLRSEWQDFILYASVILNASIAFLSVPNIDKGANKTSAAQIACAISFVCSVGAIIAGLLLIRQTRVEREYGEDIDNFLKKRTRVTRGFEILATMYSLPWSLLMWAMVSFLVAFSLECFVKYSAVFTRIPIIVAWAFVGILLLWCVLTTWESGEPLLWRERFSTWKEEKAGGGDPNSTGESIQNSWFCHLLPKQLFAPSRRSMVGGASVALP